MGRVNVDAFVDVDVRFDVLASELGVTGDDALGARLAELTGGSLLQVAGGGHAPLTRDPVLVNRAIEEFVDRTVPVASRRTWVRAMSRPRRVLYLSSPIGLGHARRDVAIASRLRDRTPGLQIDWLTQQPVTRLLTEVGERVHPASAALLGESAQIESDAGEHDLHVFQAIRRMDETLVNNFMVFEELVRSEHYDLVVADEAWDVDYFLHENPELKHFPYAWLTAFVGWLPMADGGREEAALTADSHAEMIEHRERFRWVRDASIFVGNPTDVIDEPFGPGLPGIREWTSENFTFSGFVTGTTPPSADECAELRASQGYRPEHRLCVVTVGGSGVGLPLLRRVINAVPLARGMTPELQFLIVTGPRIDPDALPEADGVRVQGYLPRLADWLAAADVALVQGGLTTCMELTASRTPFVYVPLQHHFEQNLHVRWRLDQYDAGQHLSYPDACDPGLLAEAIVKGLATEVQFRPVETDGADRAAAMLAALL
jgi:predicted glycosyltransferase